jgi:hypothetical protein
LQRPSLGRELKKGVVFGQDALSFDGDVHTAPELRRTPYP